MEPNRTRPASLSRHLDDRMKGRTIYLLGSLLALILLYPTIQHGPFAEKILLMMNTITLVAGIYAVADNRRHVMIAVGLAVFQFGLALIALSLPREHALFRPVVMAESAAIVVFYSYAIMRVLGYVLRAESVTKDTLYGGLSVYLLLGIGWSAVYSTLEIAFPGSFNLTKATTEVGAHGGLELIYFSFVTLTTLGYGDVTPITDRARSLAIFQTITGQLYLTVMVARLVSMYRPARDTAA